jgi:hypothetical protein
MSAPHQHQGLTLASFLSGRLTADRLARVLSGATCPETLELLEDPNVAGRDRRLGVFLNGDEVSLVGVVLELGDV